MEFIHTVLKKIYKGLNSKAVLPVALKVDMFLEKHGGRLYQNTIGEEKKRIHYGRIGWNSGKRASFEDLIWKYEEKHGMKEMPLVSIIVPNYNHAPYLKERLDSIYAQTYKNYEVILLDDCSKDESRKILQQYADEHSENTITIFNKINAGKVFKQWNKGLQAAKGDLIWIAESDDYCKNNFLEEMVKQFCYESVMIAFARSEFFQDGKKIWSTEEYLSDLSCFKWDKPFVMTAAQIVKNGFAYKNMIPNVSSAVFRNFGRVPQEVEDICGNLSLSGDWIFYLSIMKGGTVAYTNTTTNYYRVHEESTSLKVQKTMQYYEEWQIVSKFVARNYKVNEGTFERVLSILKNHYQAMSKTDKDDVVEQYYNVDEINEEKKKRTSNILMGCYSLIAGGGETYPIHLANEMRRQGLSVTLLNFNMAERNESIRKIVNPDVPLVSIESMDYFYEIMYLLDADIIHSHHASVDVAVSSWLTNTDNDCKQIITLHGMYEALEEKNQQDVLEAVTQSCKKFVYIADKNLEPFKKKNYYHEDSFIKLDNGLPELTMPEKLIERKELGIEEDAFVLCIVSRGIAEKGWAEGIRAVEAARKRCSRPIHLIILGDGPVRKQLEHNVSSNVHFMGLKSNTRDYFLISDVGFLPSRFQGESYPLVVADSLICGKPVIATDIAEVRNQLKDKDGEIAGKLISIKDWVINEQEMEDAIVELVENNDEYCLLKSRVVSASEKFNITDVVDKYLKVYSMN